MTYNTIICCFFFLCKMCLTWDNGILQNYWHLMVNSVLSKNIVQVHSVWFETWLKTVYCASEKLLLFTNLCLFVFVFNAALALTAGVSIHHLIICLNVVCQCLPSFCSLPCLTAFSFRHFSSYKTSLQKWTKDDIKRVRVSMKKTKSARKEKSISSVKVEFDVDFFVDFFH